jgi:tRNA(adenine34) deaminase
MDETFMRLALEQARLSRAHGDFPFGAVVVHRDKVLVLAENYETQHADVTAHAEMVGISEACLRLAGSERLHDLLLVRALPDVLRSNLPVEY